MGRNHIKEISAEPCRLRQQTKLVLQFCNNLFFLHPFGTEMPSFGSLALKMNIEGVGHEALLAPEAFAANGSQLARPH